MSDADQVMPPSASGILQCLRALAQEAAMLNLKRTLSAIEVAMDVAVVESSAEATSENPPDRAAPTILH
jgi:hypothetical protein